MNKIIRSLVGNITSAQMRNVDTYYCMNLGVFVPVTGPCFYSTTPNHTHPGYLFIYSFDDHCLTVINKKTIRSVPGNIYAISPGIIHHEVIENSQPHYIAIVVAPKYFESIYKLYASKIKTFAGNASFPKKDLMPMLKEFMFESENKYPGYDKILGALSLKITHSIVRSILRENTPLEKTCLRIEINKVIEYLHNNFINKISLEDMAGIACLSPSHFSRIFKRETGQSPLEYLIQLRLKRVKKLLRAGDKNISEIALDCGFNSSAHLADCFKQNFRISPSEFKKQLN